MRLGVARQHGEILIRAEPVAQLLRLPDPAPAEPWPQRLDDLHLIAMHHHALAQLVQVVGAGGPPVVRDQVARPPVVVAQALRHVGERKIVERPALDPRLGPVQRRRYPRAQRSWSGSWSRPRSADPPSLVRIVSHDCADSRCDGGVLLGIGDGIERGLGVAGAGQQAGQIARLGPPAAVARRPGAARPAAERRARTSSPRGNRAPRRPRRACGPRSPSGPRPGCGGRWPATLVRPPPAAANPACRSCDSCMTAFRDSLANWNLSALSIPGCACYISPAVRHRRLRPELARGGAAR